MTKNQEKTTALDVESTHRLSDSRIKWERTVEKIVIGKYEHIDRNYDGVGASGNKYNIEYREGEYLVFHMDGNMCLIDTIYLKDAKRFCEEFDVLFSKYYRSIHSENR